MVSVCQCLPFHLAVGVNRCVIGDVLLVVLFLV